MVLVFLALTISKKPSRHLRENELVPANIVYLFEWKYDDVANECEQFLGPHGYQGVQVSPVTEHAIVSGRPWWERYQIVGYSLVTRSGDKAAFARMVKRCAAVGVYVYVDAVFNHMAGIEDELHGIGGSIAYRENRDYPAVPYSIKHFHEVCSEMDTPLHVRNCELAGLPDLDQGIPYVQEKIITYLNNLINLGVAGFRVDAAKHMWPIDLEIIYGSLNNLSTVYFPANRRAYLYQEVVDLGFDVVKK